MAKRNPLNPVWKWAQGASFSQGIRVGDTIYISGMAALDAEGKIVDAGDVTACPNNPERTMANVFDMADRIYASGSVPILLGGDHSFTPAAVKALGGIVTARWASSTSMLIWTIWKALQGIIAPGAVRFTGCPS